MLMFKKNSQHGFNNLTERGTFVAVKNLALSIAWKNSGGIQGGDIFAGDSVVTGHDNSIIVTEIKVLTAIVVLVNYTSFLTQMRRALIT